MPRYLKPDADGICRRPTSTIPPYKAHGLTEYTDQALPCHPDGTPVTEQDLADTARGQRLRHLHAVSVQCERLLALVGEAGIDIPTDFIDASNRLRSLPDRVAALSAAVDLLAARIDLIENGGSWGDVAEYAAAKQAGDL